MKQAKDMTPEELQAALESALKGPELPPLPMDKMARDMTAQERAEFLAEHKKRFGL
jgi:ribosomal protein L29